MHLERLYPTSQTLAQCISFSPAPNKAIVGTNAFAHEAGIHQHGVLANPLTYEIMTPESVGVPHNRMVLGKHSGRHALAHRLSELGYKLSMHDLEAAYHRFTELADRKKSSMTRTCSRCCHRMFDGILSGRMVFARLANRSKAQSPNN